MHDKIPHLGIVDCALRLRLPGRVGAGVIRIDADEVELAEVSEFHARHTTQLAAKDEVEQLLPLGDVRHETRSAQCAIYEEARRSSLRSSMSVACLSRPAATSIPCRGTGRL
jgi:hypothetical protein